MGVTDTELARTLRELIAALDRRSPHIERAGEASIARDAAALKAKAQKRLAELAGRKAPVAPAAPDRSPLSARKK